MASNAHSDQLESVSEVQPKRKLGKTILIISGVIVAVLMVCYFSYNYYLQTSDKLLLDPTRDYSRSPFSMVDATEYCRHKTERRYGDSLALSYIDHHSTRMDAKTGIYKIFLFVRVGDLRDYSEEAIHCFIDPERQVLTHYRTINLHKASLMARAARLFERF